MSSGMLLRVEIYRRFEGTFASCFGYSLKPGGSTFPLDVAELLLTMQHNIPENDTLRKAETRVFAYS
jgi:hypothetical protein